MPFQVEMAGNAGTYFSVGQCKRSADNPATRAIAKKALQQEMGDYCRISFSHLEDETWAVATTMPCRIGIDAAREAEFAGYYPLHKVFHPTELATGLSSACLWSMKEAVAKALGCGFDGLNPLDITLQPTIGIASVAGEFGFLLNVWSRRHEAHTWLAVAYSRTAELISEKEGKIVFHMEF